jgi:UDP-3-O-acyl N-acetylglucosamine deacetylase
MLLSRSQRTLARAAVVTGFGYWSGRDVRVEFRPAPENSGITFVRVDFDPVMSIPAVVAQRVESPRRTTLCRGAASVEMVEHALAALAGLQIDNCEVCLDAPELPGCDGSSWPFVEALDAAGIVTQLSPRPLIEVQASTWLGDAEAWIEAEPSPSGALTVDYRLDYGPRNPIPRQSLALRITPDSFRRELASSRTFLHKEEAQRMQALGLARRVTPQDLLVFGERGPIDNALRYPDECVRHKILDLVGDFALAGCDISAHITAHRSGHRLNAELVRALLAQADTRNRSQAA